MARNVLPAGLAGAHGAIDDGSHLVHDRLTTLVWLRLLTDPMCPLVGGNDPRAILDPPLSWDELAALAPLDETLAVLCARLNDVMQEPLLAMDWTDLPAERVARAVSELARWRPPQEGDVLGWLYQQLSSASSKAGLGAFYTPYHVSLMMARMQAPAPGESVLDPCCGSGGMLLAALQACRESHGPDAVLEVYGIDIDARAVRLCKLNLVLAGLAPAGRVRNDNALALPVADQPAERAVEPPQGSLF